MAVDLRFEIQLDCDCQGFDFTETTGSYDASNNTGGWGSPNLSTSDIDEATLDIKNVTTGTTYDQIDMTNFGYPSDSNKTTNISITSLNVNGSQQHSSGERFPDGVYRFTYTTTDNDTGTTFEQTIEILWTCNVKCKLIDVAADIASNNCDCRTDDSKQLFLDWFAWYYSIVYGGACSNQDAINNSLKTLNKEIDNWNCKNC